ncbi:MAG: type II toxin-antitoxin system HicB family antitoxin [bacterium]
MDEVKAYTLEYWREDDWFVGRIVEIPGLFNQGKSLDELIGNLYDAYFLMMEEGVPPEGVETELMDFEVEE